MPINFLLHSMFAYVESSMSIEDDSCSYVSETYLTNLFFYPRRSELSFLPSNTQELQYFICGFTTSDQICSLPYTLNALKQPVYTY
ncbi:hypothetical protein L1987_78896 [Smallanthus sonchifolius]|uniref:Uncharacterized protein n=1 Tax=Smallanthus sonchifolius TaxID=185202 RepID=A0ACB8ZE69_9ASTR|nr:hypothetical protein L1987_78896 [Smallanthus sonchifolius]